MRTQQPIISRSLDLTDEKDPEVVGQKAVLNLFLNRWKDGGNNYEDGPVSYLYVPVYDSYGADKKMVSMLLANVYWQVYFQGILADNVKGVVAVLENQCGQAFTYRIDGRDAHYLGPGDLHDRKYDDMTETTGFGAFLPGADREAIDFNCAYSVNIYPSQEMEDIFYTSTPTIFACALVAVFLFTSLVFLTYDRCLARRQKVLKNTADRSTEVISSLFPRQVQERLFTQHDEKRASMSHEPSSAFKRWSSPADGSRKRQSLGNGLGEVNNDMPIADLYPHCTIFFAVSKKPAFQ